MSWVGGLFSSGGAASGAGAASSAGASGAAGSAGAAGAASGVSGATAAAPLSAAPAALPTAAPAAANSGMLERFATGASDGGGYTGIKDNLSSGNYAGAMGQVAALQSDQERERKQIEQRMGGQRPSGYGV